MMEKWEFKPLESVGRIKFGMSRDEVHNLFSENCREFKKSKFSKNTTDDYHFCHVYYDENDNMEAIEIFDSIEVTLDGKVIFPIDIKVLKEMVDDLKYEEGYYFSEKESIGVTMNEDKMESILFGRKDYYK